MFRSRTLATFLISSVFITPALAKCELSQYVFKDQKGNEAVVKSVRECFGWYSKRSGKSSKAACETENAVSPVIKKNYKNGYQLVGNRIIKISYKGKRYNIAEVVVVGVPWLFYLVVSDSELNLKSYVIGRNNFSLVKGDIDFDFTGEGEVVWGKTAQEAYKGLAGVSFEYSRCQ